MNHPDLPSMPVGLRWTVGDVSDRGFAALRLSIIGARRILGSGAALAVVVNAMPPGEAKRRTGGVPTDVEWRAAGDLPPALARHLGPDMAEGVAWKLAPLRLFPDRWELALDNDCILWDVPTAIAQWLGTQDRLRCVLAQDVERAHGAFDRFCGPECLNTGIRGFPPGFDPGAALAAMLARHPVHLTGELDEQGLQVAALQSHAPARIVAEAEVRLCSPFWPKRPELGSHGAHFVGLNARALPWTWYGQPASDCQNANFDRWAPEIARRVGA